jgi:hypothetical protein
MKLGTGRLAFQILLVLTVLGSSSVSSGQIWDLWSDVAGSGNVGNLTNNPNGVWSFHYSAEDDLTPGNFTAFSTYADPCGTANRFCWTRSGNDPSASIAKTDSDYTTSFGIDVPGGSVFFHPWHNDDAEPHWRGSVIRWTSPIDGRVNVRCLFSDLDDNCGNGVGWLVIHNMTPIAPGSTGEIDNGGSTGTLEYPDVEVFPGDTIDFIVQPRNIAGQNNYGCDSTLLDVTITSGEGIPTMSFWGISSFCLLISGAGYLLMKRRKSTIRTVME